MNELYIYNTLTRKKELFEPLSPPKVSFYQCGATVYWTQHIGNMRAMVMADVIVRSLRYLGYTVKMVRNYTDVGHLTGDNLGDADTGEDKMTKAAARENLSPEKIAEKYIQQFEQDVEQLNNLSPDIRPKATEHIQEMIAMVEVLLEKEYAYTTDLAVYFDVSKFKNYTKLSGQKLDKNISEAGKGDVSDPKKKHPYDFALWFFKAGKHEHALQAWKSPFKSKLVKDGIGFPGWHIECSAMAQKYLGKTLDIHMGGIEHIPVHHTNEIAQSEAATGEVFARYWLHNEHLNVDGGKMSKSDGTSYIVQDIIDKGFNPIVLRYFFLQAHYRSKQNFTWEALEASQTALHKLWDLFISLPIEDNVSVSEDYSNAFTEALADDFNTPKAIAVMWDMINDSKVQNGVKRKSLLHFDTVLALQLDKQKSEEVPSEIRQLAAQREQARQDGDFAQADTLRDDIESKGYSLKDTPEGFQISKKR